MTNLKDYNFFIFLEPNIIKFEAIDDLNKVNFSKKKLIDNLYLAENWDKLKNFLHNNIFDIEKNLNSYVKDINLIISHDDFISVSMSMKFNSDRDQFHQNRLNSLLIDLKNQFKSTIEKFEIIHMIITKFNADGKTYLNISEINNFDKICLEIKFICLKRNIIDDLKEIFFNYQIKIKNIICLEYLKDFREFSEKESSILAGKVLNGLNQNEIFFSRKNTKNMSFFEKFFSFFN
tara:strand:- start:508 stop:1209 length:702 start_codon:yes stop_codon:yes gene_type:complete